jgi:hypothetical protein
LSALVEVPAEDRYDNASAGCGRPALGIIMMAIIAAAPAALREDAIRAMIVLSFETLRVGRQAKPRDE